MCDARTKHVEVHYHSVKEKVLKEEIDLKHVNIEEQIADMLTKGLGISNFEKFWAQLGIIKRE